MDRETLQLILEMNLDDYSRALVLATYKHAGVYDKGGKPYIDHPIGVSKNCAGIIEKVVAILHDLIEDTDVTLDDLHFLEFNQYIIDGVDGMSKRPGESYDDFIDRCCTNDISRRVKRADIEHNTKPERLHYLSVEKQNKLVTKYAKALNTINQFELFNYKN